MVTPIDTKRGIDPSRLGEGHEVQSRARGVGPTRRTGELDGAFGPTRSFGEFDGVIDPTHPFSELDDVIGSTRPFGELDGSLVPTRRMD
ncbi:hypothetical protein F2Q69_00021798 [Brassica cretica]|uniref:Uncharacterized protein n=1 Tax=Brassica cretica TaxID=69181 RepID=A0A8S9QH15_BRACR|nr:hypothetical protein F2Q69_00021798 [Brassica cretica]